MLSRSKNSLGEAGGVCLIIYSIARQILAYRQAGLVPRDDSLLNGSTNIANLFFIEMPGNKLIDV